MHYGKLARRAAACGVLKRLRFEQDADSETLIDGLRGQRAGNPRRPPVLLDNTAVAQPAQHFARDRAADTEARGDRRLDHPIGAERDGPADRGLDLAVDSLPGEQADAFTQPRRGRETGLSEVDAQRRLRCLITAHEIAAPFKAANKA